MFQESSGPSWVLASDKSVISESKIGVFDKFGVFHNIGVFDQIGVIEKMYWCILDKPARLTIRLVLDLFLMAFAKVKKSTNTETAMLSSVFEKRRKCKLSTFVYLYVFLFHYFIMVIYQSVSQW